MKKKIRCTVMRGGTSRGLFFHMDDLPRDQGEWKDIFCKAIGTPDAKQVDGLGGGTSSTSKVAIVKKSNRPDFDVEYTFVQVGVEESTIDMNGNCGNISSAVGPFAVDEGLVGATEPYTVINILNTNTGKKIRARVKVKDGRFDPNGDCPIPGLVQRGSEIIMEYFDPEGSVTGRLFPTGKSADEIYVNGYKYRITVIDCSNPYVFIAAGEMAMVGSERPQDINTSEKLIELECIRDLAGKKIGVGGPALPKICVVSSPAGQSGQPKNTRSSDRIDIVARTISMGKAHKTIPMTGAFALAAASLINGTIPSLLYRGNRNSREAQVRIGHPEGVINICVSFDDTKEVGNKILKVSTVRTARRIMDGFIYI